MLSLFRRLVGMAVDEPSEVEILCLAWSRKSGGRCLAGLRTDGGGWIRPIGDGPDGALPEKTEAGVLDVLRVSLGVACPKPHQPENRRLRRAWYNPWHRPCRRVGRRALEDVIAWLEAEMCTGTLLLGSRDDWVSEGQFLGTPAKASLALIEPKNLRWLIKIGPSGKRRARAVFHWGGAAYDLAVTDPVWEHRSGGLAPGYHDHAALCGVAPKKVFLTISLGEPFNGCCHKLVVAVITV